MINTTISLKSTEEWEALYKKTRRYQDFYESAHQEAVLIGYSYMQGHISIQEVTTWLRTTGTHFPFNSTQSLKLLRKGTLQAIRDSTAVENRIQPEQFQETLETLTSLKASKQARKRGKH